MSVSGLDEGASVASLQIQCVSVSPYHAGARSRPQVPQSLSAPALLPYQLTISRTFAVTCVDEETDLPQQVSSVSSHLTRLTCVDEETDLPQSLVSVISFEVNLCPRTLTV